MASVSGNQEIARRYATALFGLAEERQGIDALAADLQSLKTIIADSKDFNILMTNGSLKRADQSRAILAIADAAKFSDLTRKFLGALADARRLPALSGIIASTQDIIAKHKGEVTAEVTAAHALDKAHIDSISASLKKSLGMTVKINLTEDKSIIGGLIIRVGSKLIDSSVRTKLERLTRALKSQDSDTGKTKMKEVA